MSRTVLFLVAAALFLASSLLSPARAAEVNEAGAQKLKAMFEEMLAYQKSVQAMAGDQMRFEHKGALSVTPSGSYYAVALPYTSLVYPDGTRVEIGIISINAAPHEQEGQWKMTLALPTPMAVIDSEGRQAVTIDIGGQRAAGIWHASLGSFVKLDAHYTDIKVSAPAEQFVMTIPSARALYDLSSNEQDLWSGPAEIVLENMRMDFNGNGAKAAVGEIRLAMELMDFNPAPLRAYREKIIAMGESDQSVAGEKSSPQHISGLYNMIFDMLGSIGNGFKAEYFVSGVDITMPPMAGQPGAIHLEKANFGFDMTGFREDSVGMALRMGYDGFTMTPAPEDMPDIAPTQAKIDIIIRKIPFGQIAEMGQNALHGALENPEMAQMAGLSLMMKVPALLSQAGTTLEINDNGFGNALYNVSVNGQAVADINALNSATADIRVEITGLEALTAALENTAADPESEHAAEAREALTQLGMVRMIAAPEEKDGKIVHVLHFVMNPQGQVTVNGKDMDTLRTLEESQKPRSTVEPPPILDLDLPPEEPAQAE